jgi:peptidyl-prolyl cis-trans isomerase B (cyclophilin B)
MDWSNMFSTFILATLVSQSIVPLHTYNGISNGIVVQVELPEGEDIGHLVLRNYDGQQLSNPTPVTKGTHNLVARVPEIKNIKSAVWIELLIGGEPVGESLVVQPLASRDVPVVEEAFSPDGKATYTKIVGWKNEAEEDGIEGRFISGWRVYVAKDILIETDRGNIRVAMRPDVAPNTVWNFCELAAGGLYQNTTFHRIVPLSSKGHPFLIQGGDPTGTGIGGAGSWLPIENSSLKHEFGVISMARAGDPDSAGCQFFLCLSREGTARLDGQYCSFGETVNGKEVINLIAEVPLRDPSTGEPMNPPQIHSITLIPKKQPSLESD